MGGTAAVLQPYAVSARDRGEIVSATGPEVLSYDAVAAVLTEVGGRPVRHRAIDAAEPAVRHSANGLPPDYARFLASLDTVIAAGAEDRTTSTVADVTGRAPRSFRDFCRDRLRDDRPT